MYREAHRSGLLTREGLSRVIRVDGDVQSRLYDFFVRDPSTTPMLVPKGTDMDIACFRNAVKSVRIVVTDTMYVPSTLLLSVANF